MKTILRSVQVLVLVTAMALPCLELIMNVNAWFSHKNSIEQIVLQNNHEHLAKETIYFDLSAESIKWVKPGKEFLLQGDYYDVISSQVNETCIKLVCFKDAKEKHLSRKLASKLPELPNQENNALLYSGFQLKILVNAHPIKSISRYVTNCYTRQICWAEGLTFPPPTPPPELT